MEIIYPNEFLELLNKNKDIDSLIDFEVDNETYNYNTREDFYDYNDDYDYDDLDDFDDTESYDDYNDFYDSYYFNNFDYRDYEDDSSEDIRGNDKKDPLIKNKLVKLKIPYINVGALRPPFLPFTPWQGPWWPWNWPWSNHLPWNWNYPWSMHKKNCDEFGHCKYDSKPDKKNYDVKPRVYQDTNYCYGDYNNYNLDFEDVDFYYTSPDEIRTASRLAEESQTSKMPTEKPPSKVPEKNSQEVMMLTHDGSIYGVSPTQSTSSTSSYNKFVSPVYLRRCMFKLIYIWEINGIGYWAYLTRVDRRVVSGWRWVNMRWIPFRQSVNRINSVFCNAR